MGMTRRLELPTLERVVLVLQQQKRSCFAMKVMRNGRGLDGGAASEGSELPVQEALVQPPRWGKIGGGEVHLHQANQPLEAVHPAKRRVDRVALPERDERRRRRHVLLEHLKHPQSAISRRYAG